MTVKELMYWLESLPKDDKVVINPANSETDSDYEAEVDAIAGRDGKVILIG